MGVLGVRVSGVRTSGRRDLLLRRGFEDASSSLLRSPLIAGLSVFVLCEPVAVGVIVVVKVTTSIGVSRRVLDVHLNLITFAFIDREVDLLNFSFWWNRLSCCSWQVEVLRCFLRLIVRTRCCSFSRHSCFCRKL